ncbi:unnamed protein product [Caenorhabditis angaria]|uniref:C2H2-type domain-containing protein n=1 Tax=Caenorhabditis angaria TaxID=860376 RepID=A0A9P1IF71_9PELO|nr:unnamed protein product [Caenorhabditis angaria]
MEFSVVKKIACPVEQCGHFGRTDNIRKHLISVHRYSEAQMQEFSNSIVYSRAKSRASGVWKCPRAGCENLCNTQQGTIKHIKLKHPGEEEELIPKINFDKTPRQEIKVVQRILRRHSNPSREPREFRYKCPFEGCTDTVTSRIILVYHAREKHTTPDKKFILQRECFESEDDFKTWFTARKLETNAKFCTRRSNSDGMKRMINYVCSSEGHYKPRNEPKFTCKTLDGKNCTAFVNVTVHEESGAHSVIACFTHTDHAVKPKYVRKKSTKPRKSRAKPKLENPKVEQVPVTFQNNLDIDPDVYDGEEEIEYNQEDQDLAQDLAQNPYSNEIDQNLEYVKSTLGHIDEFIEKLKMGAEKNEEILNISRKLQGYVNEIVDVANQYLTAKEIEQVEQHIEEEDVLNEQVPKVSSFCQLCRLPVSPYENLIKTMDSWHNCYNCGVRVHEKCFMITGKDECRSCQYGMYVKILDA